MVHEGSMDEMIFSPRKEKDEMSHFPPQLKEMERGGEMILNTSIMRKEVKTFYG
jgi:hypothetical protein